MVASVEAEVAKPIPPVAARRSRSLSLDSTFYNDASQQRQSPEKQPQRPQLFRPPSSVTSDDEDLVNASGFKDNCQELQLAGPEVIDLTVDEITVQVRAVGRATRIAMDRFGPDAEEMIYQRQRARKGKSRAPDQSASMDGEVGRCLPVLKDGRADRHDAGRRARA